MVEGFVYLWRDRKRNKYYVGSHMGVPNDGYVCSSKVMFRVYRKRPQDFKRKVLKFVVADSLKGIREEEQKWLSLIKQSELGFKYYNFKRVASGGRGSGYKLTDVHRQRIGESRIGEKNWSKRPEVRAKISASVSLLPRTPESNRKRSEKLKGRKYPGRKLTEEHRHAISEGNKGKVLSKEHRKSLLKANVGKKYSEETLSKMSLSHLGKKPSEETRRKMRENCYSLKLKGVPQKRVKCPHCDKVGGYAAMKRHHFANCPSTLERDSVT